MSAYKIRALRTTFLVDFVKLHFLLSAIVLIDVLLSKTTQSIQWVSYL